MVEPDKPASDLHCDVCGICTHVPGYGEQYGVLHARWGYGAKHDGERYRVRLCESCFFTALAQLRQERRIHRLFDDVLRCDDDAFGRVACNDYWADS